MEILTETLGYRRISEERNTHEVHLVEEVHALAIGNITTGRFVDAILVLELGIGEGRNPRDALMITLVYFGHHIRDAVGMMLTSSFLFLNSIFFLS